MKFHDTEWPTSDQQSNPNWPYIESIVKSRDSLYGGFDKVSGLSQRLQEEIFFERSRGKMGACQAEALQVICSKIARAVLGDPNHEDNWVDIAGYASLVANYIIEKRRREEDV